MFCDNYDVHEYSSHITQCGGVCCKEEDPGIEHAGATLDNLFAEAKDHVHCKELREQQLKQAHQRYLQSGPLQQAREIAYCKELQQELEQLRSEDTTLLEKITHTRQQVSKVRASRVFSKTLSFQQQAGLPSGLLSRPTFAPPHPAGQHSGVSYQHVNAAYETPPQVFSYPASTATPRPSSIVKTPSIAVSRFDASPYISAAGSPTAYQKVRTPRSGPSHLRKTYNVSPNDSEPSSVPHSGRSRQRRHKARKPKTTAAASIAEPIPSSVRRSGRLSSKSKKNYAESSDEDVRLSPSETFDQAPDSGEQSRITAASATEVTTTRSQGNKRRKLYKYDSVEDDDDDEFSIRGEEEEDAENDEDWQEEGDIEEEINGLAVGDSCVEATLAKHGGRPSSRARPTSKSKKFKPTSYQIAGAALQQAGKDSVDQLNRPESKSRSRRMSRSRTSTRTPRVEVASEFSRIQNASPSARLKHNPEGGPYRSARHVSRQAPFSRPQMGSGLVPQGMVETSSMLDAMTRGGNTPNYQADFLSTQSATALPVPRAQRVREDANFDMVGMQAPQAYMASVPPMNEYGRFPFTGVDTEAPMFASDFQDFMDLDDDFTMDMKGPL